MTERQRELLKALEQTARKYDAAVAKLEEAREARAQAIIEAREADISIVKIAKSAKVTRQSIYNITTEAGKATKK